MKDTGKACINEHQGSNFVINTLQDVVIRHFPTIGSTNTWAKQNARSLPKDKITFVTADAQTAGRGRFNRKWMSPPGLNLYVSICFFLNKGPQHACLSNIPQVLAISVAETLTELGFQPKIKWPNDIQLNGKKIGGILSETTSVDDSICFIAGLGLNVNMPLDMLDQIDQPATSLLAEGGFSLEISKVFSLIQKHFVTQLDQLGKLGFHSFLNRYRQLIMHNPGQKIFFHDNCIMWEGEFHSVNEDGSLNLKLDCGEIKRFVAGEIPPLKK